MVLSESKHLSDTSVNSSVETVVFVTDPSARLVEEDSSHLRHGVSDPTL